MHHSRVKICLVIASLAVAVVFAALWIRSYWYDTFLGYEARVTQAHVNHHFSTSIGSGAFSIVILWESLNPTYKREHGVWSFDDRPKVSPMDVVLGASQIPTFHFLGFQHWIVESPGSYRSNITWIPFWFPVLLFALPALWHFICARFAGGPMTPNKSLQATAAAPASCD
jgi:hypothetical protein